MYFGKVNIEDLSLVQLIDAVSPPFMDSNFNQKIEEMANINRI
jgi:hypothetical protein